MVGVLVDERGTQTVHGGTDPCLGRPERNALGLGDLVHVADVPGRHAPGTGGIDYAAIYRGLRTDGYHGWMAMEFLPTGDAADELRKAAAETVVSAAHG